ncbi:MAG: GspH/FimT family pseudopilin [Acidobacteriota bacterium]
MWSAGSDGAGVSITGAAPRVEFGGQKLATGFTLLEVLVVMVLLGLLASLAIPPVGRGMTVLRLRTSSNQIAGMLRLARAQAVREQQIYWAGFDQEKNQVEVVSENGKVRKTLALPQGVSLREVSLLGEHDQDRASGTSYFFFSPNGSSERFEAVVASDRGRAFRIVQDWLIRSPRVEEVGDEAQPNRRRSRR